MQTIDARHEAPASAANKHGLEELPFAAVGLQPGEACKGVSERQRMTDQQGCTHLHYFMGCYAGLQALEARGSRASSSRSQTPGC